MISLVTGSSGFIGSHLVDHLLNRGDTVLALQRRPPTGTTARNPRPLLRIIEGDVLDEGLLNRVVRENQPQEIYHLAAQSYPGVSWEHPGLTHQINVQGTLNVLEAVRITGHQPAVVVASSSAIYAQSTDGTAIREVDPCEPASPYGVSKLAADHLARLYAARHAMRVFRVRPFFLIGPRKTGDVSSDWSRAIVAVERGSAKGLSVGNLDAVRDFLHIADGIDALATIAAHGEPGQAYNISSGCGWKLDDLLHALISLAHTKIEVRVDTAKIRPLDERVKIGDPAKLQSLGWRVQRSIPQALGEILEYWRHQPEAASSR